MKKAIYILLAVSFLTSCNQINQDSLNSSNVEESSEEIEVLHENKMLKEASKELVDLGKVNQEEYESFLDKYEVFSAKLASSVYEITEKDGSYSMSPLSIYMALSLLTESSANNTQQEILSALSMSKEEIKEFTKVLYSKNMVSDEKYERSITNSLWLNKNLNVKEDCLNTLANDYYTSLFSVDFNDKNKETNSLISSFIKEKTKGLIDKEYDFSEQTIFTMINTLYLLDVWSLFTEKLPYTEEVNFKNYNNRNSQVKLLKGKYNYGKVYSEESFSHFYTQTERGIKIKFIVPNDGYKLDDVFTSQNIIKVNSQMDYTDETYDYYTKCYFPEFTSTMNTDLKELLIQNFNITDLFTSNCDLSNLLENNAMCNEFIHQSKVIVSNKGIESAAVTIVTGYGDAAIETEKPIKYETFTVDKNFGYVISDRDDVILFTGAVYKL